MRSIHTRLAVVFVMVAGAAFGFPSATAGQAVLRDLAGQQLAELQAELRAAFPSTFGGAWLDDLGRPHFGAVGLDPEIEAAVTSAALAVPPIVQSVQFSERDLSGLIEELATAGRAAGDGSWSFDGAPISQLMVDIPANAIRIDLVRPTNDQTAAVSARFGAAVYVHPVAEPLIPVCSGRTNCGSPVKAGLDLYRNDGLKICNSSFIVSKTDASGVHDYNTEAGHCHDANRLSRFHPVGIQIGTNNSYQTGGTVDAGLDGVSWANASNQLLRTNTSGTWSILSVIHVQKATEEYVGETACSTKPSGLQCGTVISLNVCIFAGNPCHQGEISNGLGACGGDSGSPVYAPYPTGNSSTLAALGLITAGDATCPGTLAAYTKEYNIESVFGVKTLIQMP